MNNLDYELVGSGICGTVVRNRDIAIKRYFDDCFTKRINGDVFDKLQDINNIDFINLLSKKVIQRNGGEMIDSYTYKYIESIDDLMIDLPMEYTLETLNEYKKILDKLNKFKISIEDAYEDNAVLSKNGLVIIDPDSYKFFKGEDFSELVKHNKENILYYISNLWIEEYILKHKLKRNAKTYNLLIELNKTFENDVDDNLQFKVDFNNPDEYVNDFVKKRSL